MEILPLWHATISFLLYVAEKRKDPGVPNSLPFKETILKEAEDRKRRAEEERERQKEKRKKERSKILDKKRNLDSLVKDAQKRTDEYNRKVCCNSLSGQCLCHTSGVRASL